MPSFLIESGPELQKKDPNLLLADKIVNQSAFPPNQKERRAVRGVPVEEGLALRSESDQGWRGVVGDSSNEMILFGSQSSDPIPVGREGGEVRPDKVTRGAACDSAISAIQSYAIPFK